MPSLPLQIIAIALPVTLIGLNWYLFRGVSQPPPDFGSGQMFDAIATRYDLVNRVLALHMDLGWRQVMVNKINEKFYNTQRNLNILDIATGTADVAILLAKTIPNAKILGMDPSNNMLSIGRTKIQTKKLGESIRLDVGGVESFDDNLPSNHYDAATMSFGIRNVVDREAGLCSIHRVLKKGASLFCILEFSEPDESSGFLGYLAKLFIRHVVPTIGGILSGKPREYLHLQSSIKDFPEPMKFIELLEGLSCGEKNGRFLVNELKQMNFGSVQLYVTTPIDDSSSIR
jgi:demethylmenaquinone methyltransferase / 2-methoxy-6-polyprenyl-1,4-benzoquinol methylase